MARGNYIGGYNNPTPLSARGVWSLTDLFGAVKEGIWPNGNLNVEVGSFTKQNTTGNQDITIATDLTAAAAGTWAIVFWTGGSTTTSGTWQEHVFSSLGFVANGGGTVSQYSVATGHDDAMASSNTARRMAAKAITFIDQGGTLVQEAEMGATPFPSATSMRLNWTTQAFSRLTVVNYAIISGLTGAKVVNWTEPLSAGNKTVAVSGVDLSSDGLVLHAGDLDATALPHSAVAAKMTFGAMNSAGEQWANGFLSIDGAADSDTQRVQRTNRCIVFTNNTPAIDCEAALVSMSNEEFVVDFDTVSTVATQFISLCMSGVQSKIGALPSGGSDGALEAVTSHNFTLKGALFTSDAVSANTSPQANAAWSLGASDLTNQRSAGLLDIDAQATTAADSVWRNNAVVDIAASTTTYGALTSYDEDSITLTWSGAASAPSRQVLYLLLG